jgi:hypothetical protein
MLNRNVFRIKAFDVFFIITLGKGMGISGGKGKKQGRLTKEMGSMRWGMDETKARDKKTTY